MESTVLRQADSAYRKYRIPGMLVTDRGTLLCWFEARREASDWAEMDILLMRSEDGGRTFFPPQLPARGTHAHPTVNNPVMMQDRRGRIHFLYCEDYTVGGGRVLHRVSSDEGASWSEAEDITAACRPGFHNAFALGPGHGIRTSRGTLLVPVWMVPKDVGAPLTAHTPSVLSTLYSEDDGETWHSGQILPVPDDLPSPNEAELTELPDHRIYLNFRLCRRPCRGRAYSETGFSDWTEIEADTTLTDPNCFASAVRWGDFLAYAGCRSETARDHVTVLLSPDGGKTWNSRILLDQTRGGYTESAVLGTDLLVLYERDYGESCVLVRLKPEER